MKIKVGVLVKVEKVIDVDSEDLERLEDYWRNHWFKSDFDTEWIPEAEEKTIHKIEETILTVQTNHGRLTLCYKRKEIIMEELDLKELFSIFLEKKLHVLLIIMVLILVGYVYSFILLEPEYQSKTSILLAKSNTSPNACACS